MKTEGKYTSCTKYGRSSYGDSWHAESSNIYVYHTQPHQLPSHTAVFVYNAYSMAVRQYLNRHPSSPHPDLEMMRSARIDRHQKYDRSRALCESRAADQQESSHRTFFDSPFLPHSFSRLPLHILIPRPEAVPYIYKQSKAKAVHIFIQWRQEGHCCCASTTSGQVHAPTSTPFFPANPLRANQMPDLGFLDDQMYDISRQHLPDGKQQLRARKAMHSPSLTVPGRNSSKTQMRLLPI